MVRAGRCLNHLPRSHQLTASGTKVPPLVAIEKESEGYLLDQLQNQSLHAFVFIHSHPVTKKQVPVNTVDKALHSVFIASTLPHVNVPRDNRIHSTLETKRRWAEGFITLQQSLGNHRWSRSHVWFPPRRCSQFSSTSPHPIWLYGDGGVALPADTYTSSYRSTRRKIGNGSFLKVKILK